MRTFLVQMVAFLTHSKILSFLHLEARERICTVLPSSLPPYYEGCVSLTTLHGHGRGLVTEFPYSQGASDSRCISRLTSYESHQRDLHPFIHPYKGCASSPSALVATPERGFEPPYLNAGTGSPFRAYPIQFWAIQLRFWD